MKKADKKLVEMLNTNSPSAIERYFENERLKNLPQISAKISFYAKSTLIKQEAGLYTVLDRTLLYEDFKQIINIPLFGNYDYAADFAYFFKRTNYLNNDPKKTWVLNNFYKYYGQILPINGRELAESNWNYGDIIFVFYCLNPIAPGIVYFNIINIGMYELPYRSLLHYLITDSFYIKNYKFTFEALSNEQFNIPVEIVQFSTFGKNSSDSISLNAYRKPTNAQSKIVDVPYNDVMNKYTMWFYGINYDCSVISFDLTVFYIDKSKEEYRFNIEEHRNKTGLSKFSGDDSNFFDD